ncbi:MAG: acyl-CoA dehydrogenase family protein [Burkholderiaceae bacterium]|nr:acyl-CoA dehydrogenase family protein [Burkholderiaceae bacterium]
MWTYNAPLRDMHFVIEEVLKAPDAWAQTPVFADLDADTSRQILEEAAKFATGVLVPINSAADLEGCKWVDGKVTTPQGYPAAYKAFIEGGWPALACDPEYGGQGLPALVNAALNEMIAAANHGWTMYPGLLHGAYDCIKTHGSEALKARYLNKIVSGEWLATMNLTEPQAGSDLGQVRSKAEAGPVTEDGASWLISGTKIFISGGDQDMTDNIVHLVLCRLPDAPAGSKGLSLMLAPKFLPDGSRNAIRCDGIEKKMGIKGSATCVMSFEGATGWLVGEPHRGLAAMFVMMNSARLHVGLQGLGHLEMAQQNAHTYARERVQGRVQSGSAAIAQHPAVRRTLWSLRALCEGERVVAYWTAQLLDEAHHHPDAAQRDRADGLVALLTPVAKAFFTDNGNRGANEALQIWGGYGFIHDYGIEQTVRDSRIAMIYEGTNEIQAIDLLQRKVLDDGGAKLIGLLEVLEEEAKRCPPDSELAEFAIALNGQIAATREALGALVAARQADPEWSLRVADDFLRGLGLTLLAWAWARSARIALPQIADAWYADKVKAARFGVQWLLPEASWRWQRVMARAAVLPEIAAS